MRPRMVQAHVLYYQCHILKPRHGQDLYKNRPYSFLVLDTCCNIIIPNSLNIYNPFYAGVVLDDLSYQIRTDGKSYLLSIKYTDNMSEQLVPRDETFESAIPWARLKVMEITTQLLLSQNNLSSNFSRM